MPTVPEDAAKTFRSVKTGQYRQRAMHAGEHVSNILPRFRWGATERGCPACAGSPGLSYVETRGQDRISYPRGASGSQSRRAGVPTPGVPLTRIAWRRDARAPVMPSSGSTMPAFPGACYVRFFLMDAASADHGHAPPCLPDTRAPVRIIQGSALCCRESLASMDARETGRDDACVAPPAAARRGDPTRA